jgi:hypothetical protein
METAPPKRIGSGPVRRQSAGRGIAKRSSSPGASGLLSGGFLAAVLIAHSTVRAVTFPRLLPVL